MGEIILERNRSGKVLDFELLNEVTSKEFVARITKFYKENVADLDVFVTEYFGTVNVYFMFTSSSLIKRFRYDKDFKIIDISYFDNMDLLIIQKLYERHGVRI